MLSRLILLAVCGLAPIFAVHAQTPAGQPLSVELHVGTAGNNEPRLIWIPTRWTPAVRDVRFMRRLVGTQPWEALRAQSLRDRELLNLTHATPADFARLRQKLLSDFTGAAVRGYASYDDVSKLPQGDYEYGLFARVGDAEFLDTPVAAAIWTPSLPQNLDAGLKPLGLFRDAGGLQGQVAVDARRMMSWAVGVRVMERRSGFAEPRDYPMQIPATRDGWTAICYRPKQPLPQELIFRIEDTFGNYVEQTIDVDIYNRTPLGKPAVDAKACMPVQPPYKLRMPSRKLSTDLELFVGTAYGETRVLWIPKKWPPGMEGVQIMRRRGAEPWTAVGDVRRPSEEFQKRIEAARNPLDFQEIRRELRSAWREKTLYSGFGFEDEQAEEIPDGVVEYGAFPVIKGARSAEPAATFPWLAGSETDADFGITGPRMLRDGEKVVAAFSVDGAKLDEKAGKLRILQMESYGSETLYTEVIDGGGPRKWKYLCVPIDVGRTRAVKFDTQNLVGQRASLTWPIEEKPATTTDPAAMAQCFIPPPPAPRVVTPMAITSVTDKPRPPPPSPPPPPRVTNTSARITHMVDAINYYPPESRRRGEEGAPVVRVCVGPTGALLRDPEVTENSGFPDLDAAAVKVAKAMRYAPGRDGGIALQESCVRFKVKFFQSPSGGKK